MRRGEVLGIRWRDLKLDQAQLSVVQQIARVRREDADGKPVFDADGKPVSSWGYGPTKTKAGKRSIALDKGTVDALRGRRAMWATEKVKAGQVYRDEDLVFCKADGSRLDPDVVSLAFERLVAKSGLPKIRFHDL